MYFGYKYPQSLLFWMFSTIGRLLDQKVTNFIHEMGYYKKNKMGYYKKNKIEELSNWENRFKGKISSWLLSSPSFISFLAPMKYADFCTLLFCYQDSSLPQI